LLTPYELYIKSESYIEKTISDNFFNIRHHNFVAAGGSWGVKNHKYQSGEEMLGRSSKISETNPKAKLSKEGMIRVRMYKVENEVKNDNDSSNEDKV